MTSPTTLEPGSSATSLSIRHVPFGDIRRADWDRLLAATPSATPFTRWTFHRAWWDAYAGDVEDHYLTVFRPRGDSDDGGTGGDGVIGILPLMVRELASPRSQRPEVAAAPSTRHLFMAASYHADYATILAAESDLPEIARTAVRHLAEPDVSGLDWDVIDLRRLHERDPALATLDTALREQAHQSRWDVQREIEDVCPVVTLADDWDTQLAGLARRARHEIRRKLRRAGRHGLLQLRYLPLTWESATRFIGLHQARWGSAGLFADTESGERGRSFLRRLVELEASEGDAASLHLAEVTIGDDPVYALAGFAQAGTCYFYNAGLDPDVLHLSPGAVGTAVYLRDRLAAGDRRFDFLRGDEAYKYAWGAVDEAVHRIVVERR